MAISNHQIQSIDYKNNQVTFAAKDYKHGGAKTSISLSTQEFVRRFALHILPKGFTRIRHFGILSSSWKKEKLPELQATLVTEKINSILPKEPILHRKCPSCKKGRLYTLMLFDARGPPPNWQQLLKNKTLMIHA